MTGLDAAGLTATFSDVSSRSLPGGIDRQNRQLNFWETLFGTLLATVLGR